MMDVPTLLEPVPGPSPCGRDLRTPSRAPELFDAQDALYRARTVGEDGRTPGWDKAAQACETILASHSKDLEAAAAAVEAWVGISGLAGLAAGGTLLAALADAYWADLYPAPPADELTAVPEAVRLQPLQQVQTDPRRLPALLRRLEIPLLVDGPPVSFSMLLARKGGAAIPSDQKKQWDAIVPQLRSGVDLVATGLVAPDFWDDLLAAAAAWRRLESTIQALAPNQSFSCRPILDELGGLQRLIRPAASLDMASNAAPAPGQEGPDQGGTHEMAPEQGTAGQGTANQGTAAGARAATAGAGIDGFASREAALQQLAAIAAYFRVNEPFSPVSHILDEAIRRARLGWLEWIAEVIPDERQREAVFSSLGLRPNGR